MKKRGRTKGFVMSEKHKKAISKKIADYWISKNGTSKNFGKVKKKCPICGVDFIKNEKSIYCGRKCHGVGNGEKAIGRVTSIETRKKLSESHKGEKSNLWKGGITQINMKIRKSLEYRLWRESVFARDNWTCIWGGKEHGNKLQADHIKPFSLYPELRFAIDNGRTLCVECHRKTDTYGNNKKMV